MTDTLSSQAGAGTINVPREIANADSVFLVKWLLADGARVTAGSAVCEIETSKAAMIVEASADGYLRHGAPVGAEVAVGGVLGYVVAAENAASPAGPDATANDAPVSSISAKARKKIEELGLDIRLFEGRGLVREGDVLAVAAQSRADAADTADVRGAFRVETLGAVQRRVARAMEQSMQQIPACYMERTVALEPVQQRAREATQTAKTLVSVADVIVAAVARACSSFGRFNACFLSESEIRVFEHVNVGVAVDIEGDLYVAVVKDAGTKDLAAIAKDLRNLQYLAQRRRLDVEQLTGGTVTVTSMLGRGIHGFKPILFPLQTAIVGICDSEQEGRFKLTLGFDHRVANGSQAAEFLRSIEQELKS